MTPCFYLKGDGSSLIPEGFAPHVTVSDDASRILVVIGLAEFYVWEKDQSMKFFTTTNQQAGLKGTWSQVSTNEKATLPGSQAKDATCNATFFVDDVSMICHLRSLPSR